MERGSFQGMKSLNKSIILTKILNDGPISRAQIAKETNLTPPTVGSLVKELMEQKIVVESAQGTSQGGRKPTLLVIDEEAFYIVGVDAGPSKIEAIVSNLSGKIIAEHKLKIPKAVTKESFLTTLIETIEGVIAKTTSITEQIIGIGIAMHGVVDAEKGEALFAPNLNLRNVAIQDALSKHFPYLIKVENDARSLALAENWFGQGKDCDRIVVVNIGTGVGAGVVINNELYHGDAFIAGEIGHMTVDLHGEKCVCGNQGCLQTLVSGPSIARRAMELQQEQGLTDAPELTTAKAVYEAAQAGDAFAEHILTETGVYLGIGITNLIHTFNPAKIILNGGVAKAGNYLLPFISETVKDRALTAQAKETEIVLSQLGDHATSLGAVSLILVDLFATNGEIVF